MARLVLGDGPPLVLLHGVGLDHGMWRPLAGHLADRHKVIAYDLIGHGSAPSFDGAASLGLFTAQLWGEMAELGVARFDLCGFSMGAMIAQAAARERPEAIANLVLMSGVHRRSQGERDGVAARLAQARRDGPAAIIDAALTRWFTPAFQESNPEVIGEVRQRLAANRPADFLTAYGLFAEADQELAELARAISCRTLVTTGALDSGSTPAMMHALAAELPDARRHLLEGLAHMAPVEDPATVAKIMQAFLAGGQGAGLADAGS